MPRPKKAVVVEETSVQEYIVEQIKPSNQTIQAPMIDASQVEMSLSRDFEIIPEKSPFLEEVLEPEIEDLSSTLQYDVFAENQYVETVYDESERLLFYLNENMNQLQDWIVELSTPTNNEEDLALFNTPDNGFTYKSLRQYFAQNGLAPVPPKITDWMTYYLKKHSPITKEEIAILAKGNLKYSFVPKSPE